MDYARVLRLPQYFRNLQRLGEIVRILVKHGFGDLVDRVELKSYFESSLKLVRYSSSKSPSHETRDIGARLRMACEELGPTFIKFAQIVATRPDIFPQTITRECRKLQDKVPPFPSAQAKQVIELELGKNISDVFSWFEESSLAAASIAQVHRAKLKDGKMVVVKVQRPQIERIIDTDVDILRGLAALVEEHIPESRTLSPVELIEEFAQSLKRECDFRREALSVKRYSEFFPHLPGLVVPQICFEYSSKRVITEEYIDGVKTDDLVGIAALHIDTHAAVVTLTQAMLESVFEYRFFHADPHPGNVLLTKDGKVALVDFGLMGRLDKSRIQIILNFLLSLLERDLDRMVRILSETQTLPPDLDEITLKNQVAEILDNYLGQSLGKLDVARLITDVFEVIRTYGIKPPRDLLLVGKSLTTLIYIGATLDPNFDPIRTIKPYLVKRFFANLRDPQRYRSYFAEVTDSYHKLFLDFPGEMRSILRSLSRNHLAINVSSKDFHLVRAHQNSLLNRFIFALVGLTFFSLGFIGLNHKGTEANGSLAYSTLIAGLLFLIIVWFSMRSSDKR